MKPTKSTARSSLALILASAAVSWLIVMLAQYLDLVVAIANGELYSYATSDSILYPSKYLYLLAVAIFTVATLLAKKRADTASASGADSLLVPAVRYFSSTALIIALVLSAVMGISVFFEGFLSSSDSGSVLHKIFNTYVPILLYTAILISVLLTGFIFKSHTAAAEDPLPISEDAVQSENVDQQAAQKNSALGWSIPIITVALGLIIGLIVYDVTGTSLEVWIWVLILSLVALGVYLGVHFSQKSLRSKPHENGIAHGAATLNLILAIVFAVTVSFMSFGYGSSAINSLRIHSDLSLSAYSESNVSYKTQSVSMPSKNMMVWASGSGFKNGTTTSLTLEPGETLASETVDRYGYAYLEAEIGEALEEGSYTLRFEGKNMDGETSLELKFEVDKDAIATFPEGSDVSNAESPAKMSSITPGWVLEELLPAFVLLLLVLCLTRRTILTRSRL